MNVTALKTARVQPTLPAQLLLVASGVVSTVFLNGFVRDAIDAWLLFPLAWIFQITAVLLCYTRYRNLALQLAFAIGLWLTGTGFLATAFTLLALFVVVGLGAHPSQAETSMIKGILFSVPVHLVLFLAAIAGARPSKLHKAVFVVFVTPVLMFAASMLVSNVYSARTAEFDRIKGETDAAETARYQHLKQQSTDAITTINAIEECLLRQAGKRRAVVFPATPPKDPADQNGCLGASFKFNAGGYTFQYQPSPAASDGEVHGFTLSAIPDQWSGTPAYFYTEEGMLYKSYSPERTPVSEDKLPMSLAEIQSCVPQYRVANPGKSYPALYDEAGPVYDEKGFNWCLPLLKDNTLQDAGYEIAYKPIKTANGISRFEVTARPERYGDGRFRSYHLDQTGIMRATALNRSALGSDPEVRACEHFDNCEMRNR